MSIESRRHQYGKVFGHWQIKEFLGSGSGGKSAVFRLEHTESPGVESALKVVSLIEERGRIDSLSPERRNEYVKARKECSERAESEVRLMNDLQGNTNIVDYLDHTFVDWSDETGFGRDMLIRMERLSDLRGEISRGRIFDKEEVLKIGRDISTALILCHKKGILHRDIKPENIFINKNGNYKLGDFGISRIINTTSSAVASTGIGTPQYWAPEQTSGKYDVRVDIYSLGLVLYELSNRNRLPFAQSSYVRDQEIHRRLLGEPLPVPSLADEELSQVILTACAFRPEERYQTAEAFLRALNRLDDGTYAPADCHTVPAQGDVVQSGYRTMPAHGDFQKEYTPPVSTPVSPPAKAWKKYLPWILLILAVILAAFLLLKPDAKEDSEKDNAEGTTEAASAESTPADAQAGETAGSAEIAENVVVSDAFTDAFTEGLFNVNCCYHIPRIQLSNGLGDTFNQKVYNELYSILQTNVYAPMKAENTPYMSSMRYTWGQHGQLVSFLVSTSQLQYEWTEYYVYHVSAQTGEVLTNDQLLEAYGMPKAEFHAAVEEAIRTYFEGRSDLIQTIGEEEYEKLIADSVAAENVQKAVPYIGPDGDLFAIAGTYWPAGAGYYPNLFNLTGTAAPAAPACTGGHTSEIPATETTAAPTETPTESLNPLAALVPGDTFHFGRYEQDNNFNNGSEDIEWIVLENLGDRLFVISKYALDCQRYHTQNTDITWETASIRNWLNYVFFNDAFTEEEQEIILTSTVTAEENPVFGTASGADTQDKIYLPSIQEVETYCSSASQRICRATTYAVKQNAYVNSSTRGSWWLLRTAGMNSATVVSINSDGSIDYDGGKVAADRGTVRPVMWISIE